MFASNNPLYTEFFFRNKFVKENIEHIHPTFSSRYGVYSVNSFCFGEQKKERYEKFENLNAIKGLFDIHNQVFDEKFEMAIGGGGQEARKINILHSSSLAALLCFYSISKEKPLRLKILDSEYVFTESLFEVQNSINANGSRPFSNMDVVLRGEDQTGRLVTFFCECKFSEYLIPKNNDKISIETYGDIYKALGDNFIDGIVVEKNKKKKGYLSIHQSPRRPGRYCEGIKQMICHYTGIVRNYMTGKHATYFPHIQNSFSISDDEIILLGEIVYRFPAELDKGRLSDYDCMYQELSKHLNCINRYTDQLYILPKVLTYQDIFANFELDPMVKEFLF